MRFQQISILQQAFPLKKFRKYQIKNNPLNTFMSIIITITISGPSSMLPHLFCLLVFYFISFIIIFTSITLFMLLFILYPVVIECQKQFIFYSINQFSSGCIHYGCDKCIEHLLVYVLCTLISTCYIGSYYFIINYQLIKLTN